MVDAPDVVNDFEVWATVSARLLGKSDAEQRAILGELGLLPLWRNANDGWAKALASDIVDMRLDRAQRYGEICARVMSEHSELPDFRHRATFGERDTPSGRGTDVKQVGGTPFSDDPLDHQPTHRIDLKRHPNFVASMTSNRMVEAPLPDQNTTQTNSDNRRAKAAIDAVDLARAWPLEHYARYVAELEAGLDSPEAVGERFGLPSASSRTFVRDMWDQRLAADPELRARYAELVAKARQKT